MAHNGIVYDSDPHFKINVDTRQITNESTKKTSLIQFDHKSERFSFEMDRFVEGHDMTECNRVEVHFTNIGTKADEVSEDVYDVVDVHTDTDDENKIVFSWLLSSNATKYEGKLKFLIRFACTSDDGTVEYAWHTAKFNNITISKGLNNGKSVVDTYSDILAQWEGIITGLAKVATSGVYNDLALKPITLLRDQPTEGELNNDLISGVYVYDDGFTEIGGMFILAFVNTNREQTDDGVYHNHTKYTQTIISPEGIRKRQKDYYSDFDDERNNYGVDWRDVPLDEDMATKDYVDGAIDRVKLDVVYSNTFEPVQVDTSDLVATPETFWDDYGVLKKGPSGYAMSAVSPMIEVYPNKEYFLKLYKGFIKVFDANKVMLQTFNYSNGAAQDRTFTTPENAKYMAITWQTSILNDSKNKGVTTLYRNTPTDEELDNTTKYTMPKLIIDKGNILDDFKNIINPMMNKIIVNFGDSIFGNRRPPNDVSTTLAELTGATVHNCAFGGCRMGQHTGHWDAFSMYRLADSIYSGDWSVQDEAIQYDDRTSYAEEPLNLLKNIDFSAVDTITIAYGTNDFGGGNLIDNVDDVYDTTTMGGALRYSIEKILAAYPNIKIVLCTPTYRTYLDNSNNYVDDSDTHTIYGRLLTEYVDKIKEIGKDYHLSVIDNYDELGINKFNRTRYFPTNDGTHHNGNGVELIARHIAKKLF